MNEIYLSVGFILAFTEVFKRVFKIPKRFIPGTAILVGIGVSLFLNPYSPEQVLVGILLGLSASGLWSGSKAVVDKR